MASNRWRLFVGTRVACNHLHVNYKHKFQKNENYDASLAFQLVSTSSSFKIWAESPLISLGRKDWDVV